MSDFWENYWKNIQISEPQITVGRTKFGCPVSNKTFRKEMDFIKGKLNIAKNDHTLDLCSGNGIVANFFAPLVSQVIAIDISQKLLNNFISKETNIRKICQNLNTLDFNELFYDKVIWYFAIQHFDLKSTAQIVKGCLDNLQLNGMFYIGDIPDLDKKWAFYSKPEYKAFYYNKIIRGEDHIGTWFQKEFFIHLLKHLGYKDKFEIIEKPEYHFNSAYRFDILIWK